MMGRRVINWEERWGNYLQQTSVDRPDEKYAEIRDGGRFSS